jgi:hypothetical protein
MYFSPLPLRNKPHEGVMTHLFILRPVSIGCEQNKNIAYFLLPSPTNIAAGYTLLHGGYMPCK